MPELEEYAHLSILLTYVYISTLGVEMESTCTMSFCLRFLELEASGNPQLLNLEYHKTFITIAEFGIQDLGFTN